MSQLLKLRHVSSSCRNAAPFRQVQSTLPFTQTSFQSSTIRHHHFTTSSKRNFHHPFSSPHNHLQQQLQQQQQRFVTTFSSSSSNATSTTSTASTSPNFRIALLLSDPQNNLLLVQKRNPTSTSTTNEVIDAGSFISTVPHFLLKQPSSTSSSASSLKQQKIHTSSSVTSHHNRAGEITVVESDDPREAIIQYANEELWLDVDESVILPFTQFVTTIDNKFISNVVGSNRCVNEQVLVYFVKVRRYFDPNEPLLDEHGRAIEHLVLPKERSLVVQCFTEDQIVQNLASNVYVNAANNKNDNSAAEAVTTTTEKQRKRTANVFDTLSIAVLGKYLVERQENMYEAKRYFARLRDIVLSSLLSCALTFLVISYYMSSS